MANERRGDVLEAVRGVFAEVIKPPPTLDEGSSMDDVAGWDSVSHVAIIAGLERRFAITLKLSELRRLTSVREIVALLRSKGF